MLTVDQVCELFQVGRAKVFRWIESGELTAVDLSSDESRRRQPRISQAAIQEFCERRSIAKPATHQTLPPVESIV